MTLPFVILAAVKSPAESNSAAGLVNA